MSPKIALVLDDEFQNRRIFTHILALVGVEAKTYSSPDDYRKANGGRWCKGDPCPCHNFMLIDNRMPGMSGLEFLRKLGEEGCQLACRRKTVISGDWTVKDLDKTLKKGYQAIKKPFKIADIRSWIEEELSHGQ